MITKKMQELQSSFPILKKINPQMSNNEKLLMFMRDSHFRHRLCEKLLEQVTFALINSSEVKNNRPSRRNFIRLAIVLSFRKSSMKMIWSRFLKSLEKFQSSL